MKFKFLKTAIVGAVLLIVNLSSVANATIISLTNYQEQTVDGQNFSFVFNNLLNSDGTGGMLIIRARGDYDGQLEETLAWHSENVLSISALGGFVNGIGGVGGPFDFAISHETSKDIEFQKTYSISNSQLQSILADGIFNVTVDLSHVVGVFSSIAPKFVEISISYNSVDAPEPLSLAIFALVALGLAARRFKK